MLQWWRSAASRRSGDPVQRTSSTLCCTIQLLTGLANKIAKLVLGVQIDHVDMCAGDAMYSAPQGVA